jgi:membrane protein implicated in regulation of membrane protease activity
MNIGPELLWLLLGIAAVLAEVLAVAPGIGLLFTGLGALGVSLLLYSLPGADISLLGQLTWFLAFTAVWAVLLWKPMKRWRMPSAKSGTYSNIVGDRATVGAEGLRKGEQGQVTWSGTVMNAELADDATLEDLPAGATVEVAAVRGNTLIVKNIPGKD